MKFGKSYGVSNQVEIDDSTDLAIEELSINGYSILSNILNEELLATVRLKLDLVYKMQEEAFGAENLAKINEKNIARCPLLYDDLFLKIAANEDVLAIMKKLLGEYFILHLQNGIINMPNEEHHQSSWHRDLPYQNFTSSKPLALGALFCIDDFTEETGGTYVLPFSHRVEKIPSKEYVEKFSRQVQAKAGSVILFDSMLFHRAGYNSSQRIRRAINNVYTIPLIKQQVNLSTALKGKYASDEFLSKFLGYRSNSPSSDLEWRNDRFKR